MVESDFLHLERVRDPYDLWASDAGVSVRRKYYSGEMMGRIGAIGLGLFDWFMPDLSRKMVAAAPLQYPIVLGHEILRRFGKLSKKDAHDALESIMATSSNFAKGRAWGLGFPWMCKNGLYGPEIPFVTHTPYVMEALLALSTHPSIAVQAMEFFHDTWDFLENLKVMHRGADDLALSYAPVDEPRMVINANSYASFAYAMHAVHGKAERRDVAAEKALKLARWVVRQQQADGSWLYYADSESGNFIDCFHSCFVVKNLLKAGDLVHPLREEVCVAVESGWRFIRDAFYDKESGLCRRFTMRAQRDPFKWDLYDQAEYLGLLIDFGLLDEAGEFAKRVEAIFRKGNDWYCRVDMFGRPWGKNFLRWGIAPFWYHSGRLNGENKCVA